MGGRRRSFEWEAEHYCGCRAGGKTRSRCVVGNENIGICISTSAESEFSVSLWDDLMAITG